MRLVVETVTLWETGLRTRLPFKYGIATMTDVTHLVVELVLRIDGQRATGIAADGLAPKWFTKDPARAVDDEVIEMKQVIARAGAIATGLEAGTVFDLWLELHRRMEAWRVTAGLPPLLAHFGTSLIERAMIDAHCRGENTTFAHAVRRGALGMRLGEIHPELQHVDAASLLPGAPLRSIYLRQTVGLADPIDANEQASRLDDGLPETLVEGIAAYGLRHFKIKFTSLADLPRLERIFDTILTHARGEVRFTLDGNESFTSVAAFAEMWRGIETLPQWRRLQSGLICVEQPFHRTCALAEETLEALRAWAERPPLIIDESDAEFDSVRRALDGGYIGTSHKNCKGVFRGLANACLLKRRDAKRLLHTGEDLASVGPISSLQDLVVQATLGVESVERNGHHYFRGLSFCPEDLQRRVVADHADLYRWHPGGFAALAPADGRLEVGSLVDAPFGLKPLPDLASFMRRLDIDPPRNGA